MKEYDIEFAIIGAGFAGIIADLKSDATTPLSFGPANFSSDMPASGNIPGTTFMRNTKYDNITSNYGNFLNPFTEN